MSDTPLRGIFALRDAAFLHSMEATAKLAALESEIAALKERIRLLDPYGRGVVEQSEDF